MWLRECVYIYILKMHHFYPKRKIKDYRISGNTYSTKLNSCLHNQFNDDDPKSVNI